MTNILLTKVFLSVSIHVVSRNLTMCIACVDAPSRPSIGSLGSPPVLTGPRLGSVYEAHVIYLRDIAIKYLLECEDGIETKHLKQVMARSR